MNEAEQCSRCGNTFIAGDVKSDLRIAKKMRTHGANRSLALTCGLL